jgi:rod shape-determining protein MreB
MKTFKVIRPLKDGVIADFQAARINDSGISYVFDNAKQKSLFPPSLKMVVCIPSGHNEVEERARKRFCRTSRSKGSQINT